MKTYSDSTTENAPRKENATENAPRKENATENAPRKENATDKKTHLPNVFRRLSFIILERLSCGHELCTTCLEDARKAQQPGRRENDSGLISCCDCFAGCLREFKDCFAVCPVEKCNEPLTDVADDVDTCDGPCKQAFNDESKFVTTKCCGAHLCFTCAEKIFGRTITKEEDLKCPNACILKKSRLPPPEAADQPVTCKGKENCQGTILNGFPSRGECDHEMCLQCLDEMIDECQRSGSMPRCPNLTCNTFYCVDSVVALKTLLPERASYFNDLALGNQTYDAIRDDTVASIEFDRKFKSAGRLLDIKVQTSDDDTTSTVPFDQRGNLADLIREIRRELKIFPLDKVYGYYIRRPSGEDDEKKPDEEITIDSQSVKRPINEFNITSECTLIADTSGIVQPKTATLSNANEI
ncbi:unnamed protein product [Anisakis simplex]|uniref:RING-type domain-containing protein n=1 Tax=Anisakis simplex TaxID=6269 RepID=A0A3P6SNF5_ANISI|nr:unnamed protein product [Anisakis simplex]